MMEIGTLVLVDAAHGGRIVGYATELYSGNWLTGRDTAKKIWISRIVCEAHQLSLLR